MLIYNFDKCKLDNNNKVKGIYLNITDNNYPEKNPQINYYTEIELDKEPAPDEAIALVKSTIGKEGIANIKSQIILLNSIFERDGDGT